jgi:hypothetical protein
MDQEPIVESAWTHLLFFCLHGMNIDPTCQIGTGKKFDYRNIILCHLVGPHARSPWTDFFKAKLKMLNKPWTMVTTCQITLDDGNYNLYATVPHLSSMGNKPWTMVTTCQITLDDGNYNLYATVPHLSSMGNGPYFYDVLLDSS